jgi:(2R)-ethylmalonyl-CoA mutase
VLALETDLLEYPDIFDGSPAIERVTSELADSAWAELEDVLALGGAFEAVDELKGRLVSSQAERVARIESGDLKVVGVNCFTESEPSPLAEGQDGIATVLKVDPAVEAELSAEVATWRRDRDSGAVKSALDELREAARDESQNVMIPTIALAHARGTTGEWADVLREVFGEYRAPTGVSGATGRRSDAVLVAVRTRTAEIARDGGPPRLLVAKPGLDGHSNGAEQIAVAARDAGFEVVYEGIRLTPAQIAAAARDEDVDVIGLSILSGSHLELVPEVLDRLRASGVDAPVVVGGIIPPEDAEVLRGKGVAAIYTPKDFQLSRIMAELAELSAEHRKAVRA